MRTAQTAAAVADAIVAAGREAPPLLHSSRSRPEARKDVWELRMKRVVEIEYQDRDSQGPRSTKKCSPARAYRPSSPSRPVQKKDSSHLVR